MVDFVSSITINTVIDSLADLLQPFCPGVTIVRGQVNRVPMPESPCVFLTEIHLADLQVPSITTDPDEQQSTIHGPQRIGVQADFYGLLAGQFCSASKQALRSNYAFANMPEAIKVLYTDDGRQAPLVTGEEQYEARWILTIATQYNPTVTVPQQTATAVSVNTIAAADIIYQ
jgi:hypothetical protein